MVCNFAHEIFIFTSLANWHAISLVQVFSMLTNVGQVDIFSTRRGAGQLKLFIRTAITFNFLHLMTFYSSL